MARRTYGHAAAGMRNTITALLPLLPLLLTVYPLDQLIAKVFEILV
jgi:hypothetical protein